MIRLEIPAQVMLAVGLASRACRPSRRRCFWPLLPVAPRQGPDLGLDRHADLAGGVQAQQRVLRVRVVAVLRALEVGVGPRAGPVDRVAGLDLGVAPASATLAAIRNWSRSGSAAAKTIVWSAMA